MLRLRKPSGMRRQSPASSQVLRLSKAKRAGRSGYILPTDVVPANRDQRPHRIFWSQGLLFMAAFLAGIFSPAMVYLGVDAIGRTALTAFHVQPGLALRDGYIPCQRLPYQA